MCSKGQLWKEVHQVERLYRKETSINRRFGGCFHSRNQETGWGGRLSINLEVNRWRKLKRNDLTSSLTGRKRENSQEREISSSNLGQEGSQDQKGNIIASNTLFQVVLSNESVYLHFMTYNKINSLPSPPPWAWAQFHSPY